MIPTGSNALNELIGKYEDLTVMYGVPASGKTCCCLLACREATMLGKKVLFIDTENGFSVERFLQLSKDKELLKNIFVINVLDFKKQHEQILKVQNIKENFSLIIIDSIGKYYRKLVRNHTELANAMLIKQMKVLKEISQNIPVIVTNQVYESITEKKIKIVGGEILRRAANNIIQLTKNHKRGMILEKPSDKKVVFEVKEGGVFKI